MIKTPSKIDISKGSLDSELLKYRIDNKFAIKKLLFITNHSEIFLGSLLNFKGFFSIFFYKKGETFENGNPKPVIIKIFSSEFEIDSKKFLLKEKLLEDCTFFFEKLRFFILKS